MKLDYIIRFLYKYMFILKAASDGWRIKYIGGDSFKFYNKRTVDTVQSIEDFISKYKYNNQILNC
jgi:hypothetical protein